MVDTKITALPLATALTDDDTFPFVDSPGVTPTTKRITALNARTYFAAGGPNVDVKSKGAVGDARFVTSGVIGAGSLSTLTVATSTFTSADVGKAITIATAGAAVTPPTLGNLPHLTTISGYTNATTVILAAAASNTAGVTGARVDWGTDDSAAFQAAITAAYATGGPKAVYVPLGRYMVPTMLNVTSSVAFRGAGRDVTTIVHSSYSRGFYVTAPDYSIVELEDFTIEGPSGMLPHQIVAAEAISYQTGNTLNSRLLVRRVNVLGTFDSGICRSGGGLYELIDCHVEATDVCASVFESSNWVDRMFFRARGCTFTTPNGDLTSQGGVGLYIHPHVSYLITNCRFLTIGRYGVYENGSHNSARRPSAIDNCEFVDCELLQSKSNGKTAVTGCVLKGSSSRLGSTLHGDDTTFTGCIFQGGADLTCDDSVRYTGCTFIDTMPVLTSGGKLMECLSCLFRITPVVATGGCVGVFGTAQRTVLNDCEMIDTSTTGSTTAALYMPSTTADVRVVNCRFRDFRSTWGAGVVYFRGVRLVVEGCEFDNIVQGSVAVINTAAVGVLEGSNNTFRGTTRFGGSLSTADQQRLTRRVGVNPTSIASAATIDTNTTAWLNYDTHVITGSAAIATLSNPWVAVGVVRLVVAASGTWSTASSGNITPLSTAARTAGTVVTLLWEPTAAKWLEV